METGLNRRTFIARGAFFNLFGRARNDEAEVEGMTRAVTGPWRRGPL